jgi:hypothetical protein
MLMFVDDRGQFTLSFQIQVVKKISKHHSILTLLM